MRRSSGILVDVVCVLVGMVVGLVIGGLIMGTDAQYQFTEADLCPDERVADVFNGSVADVPIVGKSSEWFDDVSEMLGFEVWAAHFEGAVYVRPEDCAEGLPFTVLVHELAHAFDYYNGWLSDDLVFPVTDLGHAQRTPTPERELFAFCVQAISAGDHRLCPQDNLEVVTNVLGGFAEFSR